MDKGIAATRGMTVFFETNPATIDGNPLRMQTPFGVPETISRGNAFEELDSFREALEAIADIQPVPVSEADVAPEIFRKLNAAMKIARTALNPSEGG